MKLFFGTAVLVFVAVAAWRVGGALSADALGMAVGVIFGVMAGLPAALLVMASGRRRETERDDQSERRKQSLPAYYGGYPPGYGQPPVIVLAGNGMSAPQGYGQGYGQGYPGQNHSALPAPRETVDVRQFKVVGEKEEWVDEW
ncbi:MAG: hypothetical protein IT329_19025 [Caldilineaceae bacterium]|nr:hypothetical protein [Caldilineaceae bacterium]